MTGRQTERQVGRAIDRETIRQGFNRERKRQVFRQRDKGTGLQTERQGDRTTDTETM